MLGACVSVSINCPWRSELLACSPDNHGSSSLHNLISIVSHNARFCMLVFVKLNTISGHNRDVGRILIWATNMS